MDKLVDELRKADKLVIKCRAGCDQDETAFKGSSLDASNEARSYCFQDTRAPMLFDTTNVGSCVIFDWDDTLFPTSYVKHVEDSECPLRAAAMKNDLTLHASTVKTLLQTARKFARVAIVTLATDDWVHNAAKDYFNTEYFVFEDLLTDLDIPIFSARNHLLKSGMLTRASCQVKAKRDAMAQCLDNYLLKTGMEARNIISIGDSTVEQRAVKEAASATNGCWKSVLIGQFTETRPLGSLTLELRDLTHCIGQLVATLRVGVRGRHSWGNL